MPKHDLRHNLHNLAHEIWEEKLIILIDIVKDLYNIHENGFIHRDLHSGNVLIDEMNIPYIADMGLSCPTNPEAGMELSLYTDSETSSECSSGISTSSKSDGVYVEELHDIFTHWRNECKKDISTSEPSEIRKQFDESDRNMKSIKKSPIHPGAIYKSRYIATQKNTINKTNKIMKDEIEVRNTNNMKLIIDLPS
ncbi:12458_t:CDS:2 [Dentiscutata heterogama]|uniref:12458_t:CDS:1 n=1 Tax=Dentiscutata heterogama TaxID=1316150 RepID=A0ACA9KP41_9GLOM|nr:12458_t:CDS:2 [Dentiscutata heterogama]